MPAAADIGGLVFRLADNRDFGMRIGQREIVVDVDSAPAPGKRNMVFGRKRLIAKDRHPMGMNKIADRIELRPFCVPQRAVLHLDPAMGRQLSYIHVPRSSDGEVTSDPGKSQTSSVASRVALRGTLC